MVENEIITQIWVVVDAKAQLGLELSVNYLGNYQALFAGLLNDTAVPRDELK